MEKARNRVIIVDDEPSIRTALGRLLGSYGYEIMSFASARELLDAPIAEDEPCCLLLDVYLPDLNGLELQAELLVRNYAFATVFITGYAEIPLSVQAMKTGAVDFLTKPVDEEDLLRAVREAIQNARRISDARRESKAIGGRLASLTPREQEVLRHVISGLLNKQIACELGIAEKTVKVHRARVMRKLDAASLADLIRLAEKGGVQRVPAGDR